MNYRILGRTGLHVSEIGFGCWAIGGPVAIRGTPIGWGPLDDRQSESAILRALDLGINFFDTADVYGLGHSEEVLGRTLARRRQTVVIASKVGNVVTDGVHRKDFSAPHIAASCENSLRRLQTEYLDLYQLHNPPLEAVRDGGAGEALERLKSEGKILHYGVSISHPDEGEEIIRQNFGSALQVLFNVLNQKPANRLFGLAQRHDYGIIARVPLASALLSGKFQAVEFQPEDVRRNFLTSRRLLELRPKIERYLELCRQFQWRPIPAALRFILEHPAVSSAIPGAKTVEQVEENVLAGELSFPAGLLQSLREEFRSYNFYLRYGVGI